METIPRRRRKKTKARNLWIWAFKPSDFWFLREQQRGRGAKVIWFHPGFCGNKILYFSFLVLFPLSLIWASIFNFFPQIHGSVIHFFHPVRCLFHIPPFGHDILILPWPFHLHLLLTFNFNFAGRPVFFFFFFTLFFLHFHRCIFYHLLTFLLIPFTPESVIISHSITAAR